VCVGPYLAVLDERRLYLAEGCSSLFTYCTQVLHLSEHAAYGRIEAARATRKFPIILEMLSAGAVNLTTVTLLAPRLTPANHRTILEAATHKSKREVEELVAQLRPRLPVLSSVRRLPTTGSASALVGRHDVAPDGNGHAPTGTAQALEGESLALGDPAFLPSSSPPARRAVVEPLAPQQYRVQFTASAETYDKLRLAQDLLRHQIPDGDVGQIMDRALSVLLEALAKQKFAATNRSRPSGAESQSEGTDRHAAPEPAREHPDRGSTQDSPPEDTNRSNSTERPKGTKGAGGRSRHIPAEVKRKVWLRDSGRCAFVAANGRRCAERAFLEFHHVEPFSVGGEATVENIELRCRAHNGYEAEVFFSRSLSLTLGEASSAYVGNFKHPLGPGRVRLPLCDH
jgi:hypothetical protein